MNAKIKIIKIRIAIKNLKKQYLKCNFKIKVKNLKYKNNLDSKLT